MWSSPRGFVIDRRGLGEFATPGIGRSRALEKVAQFGAHDSMADLAHSSSRRTLFLKTQNFSAPRRWSQGSAVPGSLALDTEVGVPLFSGGSRDFGAGSSSWWPWPGLEASGFDGSDDAPWEGVARPGSLGRPSDTSLSLWGSILFDDVDLTLMGAVRVEA